MSISGVVQMCSASSASICAALDLNDVTDLAGACQRDLLRLRRTPFVPGQHFVLQHRRILMEECWKQEELSILNFKSTRGFENPALAQQKNLSARASARQTVSHSFRAMLSGAKGFIGNAILIFRLRIQLAAKSLPAIVPLPAGSRR